MNIKFLSEVQGLRDWKPWPKVGEVVDWAEAEAADLIRIGIAAPAEPNARANPESAELPMKPGDPAK